MSTQKPATEQVQQIHEMNRKRTDARNKFIGAIGTKTCACTHPGQAHLDVGSAPCTMCNCMRFKASV